MIYFLEFFYLSRKRCLASGIIPTLAVVFIFFGTFAISSLYAFQSPHPVELYEKGTQALEAYHGQPENLIKAQNQFLKLLEKFPESPLGYLGMSRVYTIDAYRYDDIYDMEKIRDLALPFAIKALELGPSVRAVHEHYSYFEEIFADFSDYKNRVQDSLTKSPHQPETYYAVATFIRDQNEYSKALDYYKAALEMSPNDDLKVKILKRIGYIYLNEMNEPEKAVEYFTLALKLQEQSPILNEDLGLAYLKMQQYSDAILMFTRSMKLLPTTFPEFHLLEAKGYLAEKEGKIEEAIDVLEKACQIGPEAGTAHYRLGNLYYNKNNFENAFRHFKYVIDLDPQSAQAYFFAAKSANSLGRKEQAVAYFKKYLQLDASSQEADWIRANIPELTQSK